MTSDPEVGEVLALAKRLARLAGTIQRDRFETGVEVQTKSSSIDLVTEVDHACEKALVEAIERERPGDGVLGDEERILLVVHEVERKISFTSPKEIKRKNASL